MQFKENNYFTTMISRTGRKDFIALLNPEKIQKAGRERIFREMARGQIDYTKYGEYYLDSKFIDNLIIAADNELRNNDICAKALEFYDINFPGNQLVIFNKERYEALAFIHGAILQRLQYVKVSGNVGYLTDLKYVVSKIKNYI